MPAECDKNGREKGEWNQLLNIVKYFVFFIRLAGFWLVFRWADVSE